MATLAGLFGDLVEKAGKETTEKVDDIIRISAAEASNKAFKNMDINVVMQKLQDGTASKQQLIMFANAAEIDLKGAKNKDDIFVRINQSLEGLEAYEDKLRNNPIIKRRIDTPEKTLDDNIAEIIGDNRNMSKEEYKKLRREARRQSGTIEEQNARIEAEKQGKERTRANRLSKEHEEALTINTRIDDPSSIANLSPSERRAALNEAFVSGGDRFVKNTADQAILDADLLYKVDADDDFIKRVHSQVNNDDFINDFAKSKWESGKFGKDYSSFGSKDTAWDDLTDAQRSSLIDDVKSNELQSFNDAFSGEKTTGWGPWKKTELTGEMDLKTGRQRYMRNQGFDPSDKTYNKNWNRLFGLEEDGVKLAGAYRNYHQKVMSVYNAGTSTAMPDAKDFLSKEKGFNDKQINTIMSGLGKDGISEGSKHTGLKVAAGIAAGAVALWGLSEVYDE